MFWLIYMGFKLMFKMMWWCMIGSVYACVIILWFGWLCVWMTVGMLSFGRWSWKLRTKRVLGMPLPF